MPIDHDSGAIGLPPPSGDHHVGTEAVYLVDGARPDPWDADRARELMVQLWYPAAPVAGRPCPPARYLSPSVAALVDG